MNINEHIGSRLKERRKKAHLTLEQLSSALRVTYQQVQKYERGQSKIPVEKLYECSRLLRVPIQYFFEDSANFSCNESDELEDNAFISRHNNRHLCILLAESDPVDEFTTRTILNEIDNEITIFCVHSYSQMTDVLKKYSLDPSFSKPDLIFLDLLISKKDNHALISELRRDKVFQNIPILVFANSVQRKDLWQVYKNGASSFVCKAIDNEEAKRNLATCLQYWGKVVLLPSLVHQSR